MEYFFFFTWMQEGDAQTWIKIRERQDKVKQKDAVKNSGPVTSTGPSKDHGPLYYFLFHAISTECFEMPETEARITIICISRHRTEHPSNSWKNLRKLQYKKNSSTIDRVNNRMCHLYKFSFRILCVLIYVLNFK